MRVIVLIQTCCKLNGIDRFVVLEKSHYFCDRSWQTLIGRDDSVTASIVSGSSARLLPLRDSLDVKMRQS
jgi:hypothetical protein